MRVTPTGGDIHYEVQPPKGWTAEVLGCTIPKSSPFLWVLSTIKNWVIYYCFNYTLSIFIYLYPILSETGMGKHGESISSAMEMCQNIHSSNLSNTWPTKAPEPTCHAEECAQHNFYPSCRDDNCSIVTPLSSVAAMWIGGPELNHE